VSSLFARLGRFVLWILVTVMVFLALTVTALRISLPRLDNYQQEISSWVVKSTGLPFSIGSVEGYWRNTRPSISLRDLEVENISDKNVTFTVEEVQLQLDLLQSALTLSPKIASLNVNGLNLDISQIELIGKAEQEKGEQEAGNRSSEQFLSRLESLLLRQLADFSLQDASVRYQTFQGNIRSLDFKQLNWRNRGEQHKLEGSVSLGNGGSDNLAVKANFKDHGSILDVSGDFYAQAENIRVAPWLTKYLEDETGIDSGQVSFNSWFSFDRSKPVDAFIELLPSELSWHQGTAHSLILEKGIFKLVPGAESGEWKVSGHSITARTDEIDWPELDVAFEWLNDAWTVNISQLDIASLRPLVHLMPQSSEAAKWIDTLQPSGLAEDLRFSFNRDSGDLNYSASLSSAGMKQWYLLPEVHDLTADISGNNTTLVASASLIDDRLPYGDVFQAPLRIKQGNVDIVWQSDERGWKLWSDKVSVATPDMQVIGEFLLDFPDVGSSFLSFYAETDVFNAGETWRYLPTLALGQDLTDYLSAAIQGGNAKTAQVMWFGELGEFPYQNNNGVFQAKVALNDTQFSFDTQWPAIKNMQLDLLFENASMYLDSKSARLMDVEAERVTGEVAYLGPGGELDIWAKATAKGPMVRDYMMATPLVDSVGAALTEVQVAGNVKSEFRLNIPFDEGKDTRAWGYADLPGNTINVQSPPIELKNARGRVVFDNDVVQASGLKANLLSQPISVDFKGEGLASSYGVNINLLGDWEVAPLAPYIGSKWVKRVQGHAPWQMDIDLQLNDIGFTYQIDSKANLDFVSIQYPAPLDKALGEKKLLQMQASGNQESISNRIQLPGAKYQAEIDIRGDKPVLTATNLLLGKGSFKASPIVGHNMTIRAPEFNLDEWIEVASGKEQSKSASRLSQMATPEIPLPQRVQLDTELLRFATLDWHDVSFSARKKGYSWAMKVDSAEVKGDANYLEPYDLSVSLDRLQLFIPQLDKETEQTTVFQAEQDQPLISEFDREFHRLMPSLTLNIREFWLQGYKVGKVNIDMERKGDSLSWRNIEFNSGNNTVQASGSWLLSGDNSVSDIKMFVKGDDNTELMDRFGISSGIQKAPFEVNSDMQWQGAPWSMQIDSLKGDLKVEFGKGVISDVSGAAKLLGMFSLDSIIRKMQLDFSDIFDKGLAFDSISGSGKIEKGVFVTNDILMDSVAGDMNLKGMADLNNNLVDAEVEFTPDLTSGIPVLTAFAVTPQTAVVVFAISKVISPVVDVFTKIRYRVQGSLDAPEVKELSRSRGEYKLPDTLRKGQ